MKKINKKLLLSTSLLMPILPIFATISCNNKKTNDSIEQQFDLTKLETGFYNIPADYFANSGIQLAGGFYFVLNNPSNQEDKNKMESDLGSFYKGLLNKVPKPSDEEFDIDSDYKISKPNQVAILDRDTIELTPISSTNFKETESTNLVEISVTPTNAPAAGETQKTIYQLKTVELNSQITLKFTAQADLYNVSTIDKENATLKPANVKINLSATKTIADDEQLNKYDKVTILVKKSTQ